MKGYITQIQCKRNLDDGNDGVTIWLEGQSDTCRLLKNNAMFDEIYSAILTALATHMKVDFRVYGEDISYATVSVK